MSKLWGGRFSKKTNKLVEEFTKSIHFDQKLAKYDCIGSLCHIDVLKKAKLLNTAEHKALQKALKNILASVENGAFFKTINGSFEDVHSYIQHLVEKKAGKAGLKLHTCRSRNDQVVFATKLYCMDNLIKTHKNLEGLRKQLLKLSAKTKNIVMPGYTHLQHAIPVKLASHFLAYVEMFWRDHKRLSNALNNITLTLGSGALAGTFIHAANYNVSVASYVGGMPVKVTAPDNAMDTVSDRDFVLEALSALAITGMHLSRLAEDLILWVSTEFDFISIDDAFCTGSSLMPQKKNPDILELIRGNTGRLYGNLTNVLVVTKGLPLSYNRDLQNDKEPLFDSFETVQAGLVVLTELLKNVAFNKSKIEQQVDNEALYATDLADYLVQKGVPFKTAHSVIGSLIQRKYKTKTAIIDMSDITLQSIHPSLSGRVVKAIINPKRSVAAKRSVKKRK